MPSFIRKKTEPLSIFQLFNINVIKAISKTSSLALHKTSEALFFIRSHSKKDINEDDEQSFRSLKTYLQSSCINHSSLIRNCGYFSDDEQIYCVEEYLPGHTLDFYIRNKI